MSSGLSPKLPLVVDEVFGAYNLNTTFEDLAKQNLKMLILTVPGERIMIPEYGVGLKRYLFELNDKNTYDNIQSRIIEQTSRYLDYIQIDDIRFQIPEGNPDLFPNNLSISISFTILPLQRTTTLQIDINQPI
jgi:phage baseplate assembly protein W